MDYYYLHTNGNLIYKKSADYRDFDESPFVKKYWELDIEDRRNAWMIILEALALGAEEKRIKELIDKWKITKKDKIMYEQHVSNPSQLEKTGMIMIEKLWNKLIFPAKEK